MGPVTEVAKVISEGIKYCNLLLKTSYVRKLRAAVEAAEKYIQVNERSGEFKDIEKVKQIKYLRHFAKRFWKYN